MSLFLVLLSSQHWDQQLFLIQIDKFSVFLQECNPTLQYGKIVLVWTASFNFPIPTFSFLVDQVATNDKFKLWHTYWKDINKKGTNINCLSMLIGLCPKNMLIFKENTSAEKFTLRKYSLIKKEIMKQHLFSLILIQHCEFTTYARKAVWIFVAALSSRGISSSLWFFIEAPLDLLDGSFWELSSPVRPIEVPCLKKKLRISLILSS